MKKFVSILGLILVVLLIGMAVADVTNPSIDFIPPTEANNSVVDVDYAFVNTSISDIGSPDNLTGLINWNNSLVGWWRMNEEAGGTLVEDFSGYGNNGTWNGNTTSNVTIDGKFGNALVFDGVNDYVEVPSDSSFDFENAITMSVWVNITNFPTELNHRPSLIGRNDGISSTRWAISLNQINHKIGFYIEDADGHIVSTHLLGSDYSTGELYHVIAIFDVENGKYQLYKNSVHDIIDYNISTITGSMVGDGTVVMSQNIFGTTSYLDGSIDDVQIFNRALSQEEINASYNAGLNRLYHNFTDLDDGTYNYTAYAQDLAGNVNQTETRTITIQVPPQIELISFSPEPFETNYTGTVAISYLVASPEPLNLSSLAFLYGINYTITGDMHNFISPPSNDIASEGIYRAPYRNVTPYLSWEFNDTITEGNVWQWGGGDNDSTWISTNAINATHTYINVTGNTVDILSTFRYLGKQEMYDAPKTPFKINRLQGLIFKTWDLEEIRNRNDKYLINLYFDTDWETATNPGDPISIGYCNNSYNPATDDIDVSPHCIETAEWDGIRWINHSNISTGPNSSYALPLTLNASQFTSPTIDEVNYIWLRSNALSSKSYMLNATNSDPGITNITFAETNTMWLYSEVTGVTSAVAYTPSFFMTFVRNDEELLHHLYIADDEGVWAHSEIFIETIGVSSVPVEAGYFDYFVVTHDGIDYEDIYMDGTYNDNTLLVNMRFPSDPDGGDVSHNVTIHYGSNQTLIATANNTITTTGQEIINVSINTVPYYSQHNYYTLKVVSIDDEGSTATRWLGTNFTLDADGNQGWVFANDVVSYWGMNDIPTLYAVVDNNSLISYDGGSNIYTMHVPFYKSKHNETFYFNETVYLKSMNSENVSYYRYWGGMEFDEAYIYSRNTISDTYAPTTDSYRAYVVSYGHVVGFINNSDFSWLGSDVYRQEGFNVIENIVPFSINNSTFSNNAEGIVTEESLGYSITDCTIEDNVNVGIGVYFSDDFTISNNTIDSNGGRGISIYEGFDNVIQYNEITNSGVHGLHAWSNSGNNTATGDSISSSALYDYYYSSSALGNYIIDPESNTNQIRVVSTSSVNIINSDNAVFGDDSLLSAYAYPSNYSLFVSGITQTFTITQYDMYVTPTVDKLAITGIDFVEPVMFYVSSDVANNPTWYNITNPTWNSKTVYILRDGLTYSYEVADVSGLMVYNYSGDYSSDRLFKFTISAPINMPLSIFMGIGAAIFVLLGAALYFYGIPAIFISLLGTMLSFINSQIAINGQLVQNIGGIDNSGNVIQATTVLEIPFLSYLFLFMGLIFAGLTIYHVAKELENKKESSYEDLEF